MEKLYGSIEAGGTKFVCAVGNENLKIINTVQFATTMPEETLKNVINYFSNYKEKLVAISIASFGPIEIIKKSPNYGYITSTPKPGWENTDILGVLKKALSVPMHFTTDVNGSAYGEYICRNGIKSLVYYTIGTGIGAGVIQDGKEVSGFGHLELGHIRVSKHNKDSHFSGGCPFHGDCLEGLASGPSLEVRTKIRGENLPKNHAVWDIQAYYIAQAVMNATLSYRPEVVVLGGGVMSQNHMLDRVKNQFERLLNHYVEIPDINEYIVTPIASNNGSTTIGNIKYAVNIANQEDKSDYV
ncbi:ROK family protein [Streptococcus uberis]|uniref:fructokinase ScrK n=1 Tax=Streptococcus uberis TaxID=1349 RepID=UPI0021500F07|nr:fructokinase ScrK [Streptococcus uberis]MCR4254203.1 ROK family protein [Streptococcus uberis]MCR4256036.1 ROK family protein [Streptococcus uberis]MCR4260161.1 ROK family protein [Streptococcus uberis]MCR4262355.1 ROK family protein [Streptococcus uberis]